MAQSFHVTKDERGGCFQRSLVLVLVEQETILNEESSFQSSSQFAHNFPVVRLRQAMVHKLSIVITIENYLALLRKPLYIMVSMDFCSILRPFTIFLLSHPLICSSSTIK